MSTLTPERVLDFADTSARVLANRKVSMAQKCLYITLINNYPQLLEGKAIHIQIYEFRNACGVPGKATIAAFFKALEEIGAIEYDSGTYKLADNTRVGTITPNEQVFPFPELFDLRNTKDAKSAREKEREKRAEMKAALLIVNCEQCGSADLLYDVTARCKDCGHVHQTFTDIPAQLITVEPEASFDDLMKGLDNGEQEEETD